MWKFKNIQCGQGILVGVKNRPNQKFGLNSLQTTKEDKTQHEKLKSEV